MIEKGLVKTDKLMYFYQQIEADLFRYPSINPLSFKKSIEEIVTKYSEKVHE